MDAPDTRRKQLTDHAEAAAETVISCHETRPGRRVFTERGNTDAWISSDVVVALPR